MKNKRIILIVLIIIALIFASCQKEDTTINQTQSQSIDDTFQAIDTTETTDKTEAETSGEIVNSDVEETKYVYSKETKLDKWNGKTLNVLTTVYGRDYQNPWTQAELK